MQVVVGLEPELPPTLLHSISSLIEAPIAAEKAVSQGHVPGAGRCRQATGYKARHALLLPRDKEEAMLLRLGEGAVVCSMQSSRQVH